MGKTNSKDKLVNEMRSENEEGIRAVLSANPELNNQYVNKSDDHTPLCIISYSGSVKSAKVLIEVL